MKIEQLESNKITTFGDLNYGDCFMVDGSQCVWIKAQISTPFENCVDLEQGQTGMLNDKTPVTPFPAALVRLRPE